MKKFLCSVLIILVCAVPSSVSAKVTRQGGMYIVDDAEGYAPIRNNQKKTAYSEARNMAYRDALEKALGACVTGITEMENFAVTRDKVFSKSSGLIKDFRILSENIDEDGVLTIKASCKVSEKSLDGVLGPEVISMLGNPRIMLIVDEKVGGQTPFMSTTEGVLQKIFENAGYLLVDPEQARTLLHLDPSRAFDDPETLSQAAKTLKADIIVAARASAGAFASHKIHGIRLYGVSGTVQLKAVLTKTAYQISSKTASASTGKRPAQTVGGGAAACFNSAAKSAADEIVYKIAYNLASAGSALGGITVNIKIEGASFKDVERIEEGLRTLAGRTGELFERNYSDNMLELDMVSENTARKIASFLSDNNNLEVTGLTQQTITARVKAQGRTHDANDGTRSITVTVSGIESFRQAGSIEDSLREEAGEESEIETTYQSKTLTLEVKSRLSARDIAALLSDKDIEIDEVSQGKVSGHHR
ncbi:MAG: hypothetical protein IJT58_05685 [Synergistaceae bacterium]|nr:hypothetical protein [Synergistaceae bacterium]